MTVISLWQESSIIICSGWINGGVNVSSLKHGHVLPNGGSAVYVPVAMVNPRSAAPLMMAHFHAQTHKVDWMSFPSFLSLNWELMQWEFVKAAFWRRSLDPSFD